MRFVEYFTRDEYIDWLIAYKDYSYEDAAEDLQALEASPLYGMVDNEEIAYLCSKYKIEVQSWLKLATEVLDTQEMQVA